MQFDDLTVTAVASRRLSLRHRPRLMRTVFAAMIAAGATLLTTSSARADWIQNDVVYETPPNGQAFGDVLQTSVELALTVSSGTSLGSSGGWITISQSGRVNYYWQQGPYHTGSPLPFSVTVTHTLQARGNAFSQATGGGGSAVSLTVPVGTTATTIVANGHGATISGNSAWVGGLSGNATASGVTSMAQFSIGVGSPTY